MGAPLDGPPRRHGLARTKIVVSAAGLLVALLVAGSLPSRYHSLGSTPAAVREAAGEGQGACFAPPPRWQDTRDCPIYILDLAKEVAPVIGIPVCDISNPEIWPFEEPGRLPWTLQHKARMKHYEYQYSGGWWLAQALRNATGVLTDDIDKACIVWVDTYCYNQWFIIQRDIRHLKVPGVLPSPIDVMGIYRNAVDHVVESPRFQKRQGRDFVWHLPIGDSNPKAPLYRLCGTMGLSHQLVAEHGHSCNWRRPKLMLQETQILPYCTVAGVDLQTPIAGSHRPTLLYMQASCGTAPNNCGKLMRYQAAVALNNSGADVQVKCAGIPRGANNRSYEEVQEEMRASLFCLMLPGDTQSSNRLTETILAGCIPVFVGPPWHEMPLGGGEIDYAAFGVFLSLKATPWANVTGCVKPLAEWPQGAAVQHATLQVPDLAAVLAHLRAMPKAAVRRRQLALERERPKFYYGVPPGRNSSALADIVISNVIRHGQRLAAGEMWP